ncbi:hypothetical protein HDU93_003933, partial [Gonapodya sp. JEL0774]
MGINRSPSIESGRPTSAQQLWSRASSPQLAPAVTRVPSADRDGRSRTPPGPVRAPSNASSYPAPKQAAHKRMPPASAINRGPGMLPGVFVEPPVVEPYVPRSEEEERERGREREKVRKSDDVRRSGRVFVDATTKGGDQVVDDDDEEWVEDRGVPQTDAKGYEMRLVAEDTGERWEDRIAARARGSQKQEDDDGPMWALPFETPSRPGSAMAAAAQDYDEERGRDAVFSPSTDTSGEDAVESATSVPAVSDTLLKLLTTISDMPGEAGKNFAMARRYVFNRVRKGHRLSPAEMGMLWSKVRFEELPSKELDLAYDDPGVDKDALMECVARNLADHLHADAEAGVFERRITTLSHRFFSGLVEYATAVETERWSASEAARAVTAYCLSHQDLDESEREAMWQCVRLEELSTEELERAGTAGAQVVRVVEVLLRRARTDHDRTPNLPDRSSSLRRARSASPASPASPITPPPSPQFRHPSASGSNPQPSLLRRASA